MRLPRLRISFSARLWMASCAVAVLPVAFVLLGASFASPRVVDRLVGGPMQASADRAAGSVDDVRADLGDEVDALRDDVVARAIATRRAEVIERALAGRGSTTVRIFDGAGANRTALAAATRSPVSVVVRSGSRVALVERRLPPEWMDEVAARDGVELRLQRADQGGVTPAPPTSIDGEEVQRSAAVGAYGEHQLVAVRGGGPLGLLAWAYGDELLLVLLYVLVAAMVAATVVVLFVGRHLKALERRVRAAAEPTDDNVRLDVAGNDEMASLTEAVDELEQRLADRAQRFERLSGQLDEALTQTDCGTCVVGSEGEVLVWNPAASAILGTNPDERSDDGGYTPPVRALVQRTAAGAARLIVPVGSSGGESVLLDVVSRRCDGGRVLHVFRDADHAVQLEQARSNFLVTAAHELRTPVTTLVGAVDLLRQRTVDTEVVLPLLDDAVDRLDALVKQLSRASLVARDRIELHPADIDLGPFVREAAARCGASAELVRVTGLEQVSVRCDPMLLERALCEVFDNAGKYGDGAVLVDCAPPTDDRGAVLTIVDGGPVPPPEMRGLVFEPFARLDPDMRNGVGGLGLGLYVARRAVEAAGGRVDMVDHDGRTAIEIELPRTADVPARFVNVV